MPEDILDRYPLLFESFAKTAEASVGATKRPTKLAGTIGQIKDTTWTGVEGKTLYVGDTIKIASTLYWIDPTGVWNKVGAGKTIKIYHRVNGTYALLTSVTTDAASNASYDFKLDKTGTHYFYQEFEGDAEYEGCTKAFAIRARV